MVMMRCMTIIQVNIFPMNIYNLPIKFPDRSSNVCLGGQFNITILCIKKNILFETWQAKYKKVLISPLLIEM